MKSEITLSSIILLFGLFTIAIITSVYCYESPAIPFSSKGVFISLPAVNPRPSTCSTVSSQPDDPPNRSYPTTTTTTTSYAGTATIGTSTTTTL